MIGTKADIAKVLTAGLNGDPMVQPAASHFRLTDVVEVFGTLLAAVANEAGADVAGAVAQSFTGDAPTHEQKRQGGHPSF